MNKKILKTIFMIMISIILILMSQVVYAAESLTLDNTEVVALESGIYGEGQEVTIRFTFNKKIKGVMPKVTIYFGEDISNLIELETNEITEFTDVVDYKYTIKSGDNGELKLNNFIDGANYPIQDEEGNQYVLGVIWEHEFEKTILADTTIEWTNLSNATVEMITEIENDNSEFKVKFSNCTLNRDNFDYFVHLSHDENEVITVKNRDEVVNNNEFWNVYFNMDNTLQLVADKREIFVEVGDVYATVCAVDRHTKVPKIILKSKKITKLPQLSLTKRISAYFFSEYSSTFCWEAYSENQQNLNYKIGKVTDLNLLKSLKNGSSSALNDLLEFSKNDSKSIGTGTIKLGEDTTITDKLNLIDGAYYYVYLQLDTVNGKYVAIEDVSLYQALVGESVGANLHSFTDREFKWNLDEEEGFSDFSNAEAIISSIEAHGTINEQGDNSYCEVGFIIYNVKANTQKKHKFYYYLSNDKQDIPQYDSELWTEVDKFEIDEDTGECKIYVTKQFDNDQVDVLNMYISIYEVIADEEITTEKIEGTYKLGLNSKEITFGELPEDETEPEDETKKPVTEPEKQEEDNTKAPGKIPHAGISQTIICAIIVTIIAGIILKRQNKKYQDII